MLSLFAMRRSASLWFIQPGRCCRYCSFLFLLVYPPSEACVCDRRTQYTPAQPSKEVQPAVYSPHGPP